MLISEGYSFDDLMLVPKRGVLDSRKDADISSKVVDGSYSLSVPIISANMPSVTEEIMAWEMYKSGAIGALHRFCSIEDQKRMWNFHREAIISIGLEDGINRTGELYRAGARIFLLDVAHAHSNKVIHFVELWRHLNPDAYLIVGNVATTEAAADLVELGVDTIKVGIGPGAACTTREVTGFGVPQLTAIFNVALVKEEYPWIKVIADGGIKSSGDIVKALAAGADTVMIGRLLAGCDEAPNPGEYYGNASYKVNGHNAPEGIAGTVERVGPVSSVIKQLAWGIRSGISYAGARNLDELRSNAEWVRVSPQTMIESGTRI